MGRGAQTQTMQMTDQQLANQNVMNQAFYNHGQSLSSKAAGSYLSLLANPGYTPAQQSAINNQSLGALSSAFGALAQSAANRLARTRNSAGYGDLLDELARERRLVRTLGIPGQLLNTRTNLANAPDFCSSDNVYYVT
jgi:hypothetical protein